MKTNFLNQIACSLALFVLVGSAAAGEQEKMVIELKTNDFEVAETDISDLAVGEAKTIHTDSGKTVDILRTADGVEIYIDGELLEVPSMSDGQNQSIHEHVEIECVHEAGEDEGMTGDCGHHMMFISDEDIDLDGSVADGAEQRVIVRQVHRACESDQEGECEDHRFWVTDGGDLEVSELHQSDGAHKIVRIHKSTAGDDGSETSAAKVIIIKKGSEEEL